MDTTLLEKHEGLVVEMARTYLDNMELELGKKYKDNDHQVDATLSNDQYTVLNAKHGLSNNEFADLYSEFLKMKPSLHLRQVMGAFTQSGGNVDVNPTYDEETQRLEVSVSFIINDKVLDKIDGLSEIEGLLLKMEAMIQVDTLLSGADPEVSPTF